MKVLVITTKPDAHVKMVARHLPEWEFQIFDPFRFPYTNGITYLFENGKMEISLDKKNLSDADVVWFRKPNYLKSTKFPVSENLQEFAWNSYKRSVIWLYDLLPNSFWVSRPNNIIKGGNKLYQMQLATKLGFNVPDTLVTNNVTEVERFRLRHRDIVTKSLHNEFVDDGGELYAMYTTRLPAEEKIDFSGLAISPAIFQQMIVGPDIRVTVIGNKIFATEINKKGTLQNEVDWRLGVADNRKLKYFSTTLPENLNEMCLALVRQMSLEYGAIDLMRDNKGKYWFLEINPNGQWGFIELQTGQQLSLAIADLFRNQV
ncbi:hypothetical protein A3K01_01580 [candidate division WWE3 bacterium RIFOXYD1_FULL_43_17]|uniref:ATP-grasp domain-containing protein n=3 Tax=Katanobacteria TaxID=422282 RepID=A0A1F4XFR3_UNCKA|nr:MAG: RimK domain protein ATP-grasp [candidate division WWE3 bacterium GW2011_GWE1_41_27]KKS59249.1 MAG: RimK domain protein ATP-grasp [candidate division WWE3 bacterium GW2011_GWF2_42_42]OGC80508.1 MAG: hypothetical protein A3K01_01580 [candidate division WWE3 bacterium RIFOXYD1_FULL_43_17]